MNYLPSFLSHRNLGLIAALSLALFLFACGGDSSTDNDDSGGDTNGVTADEGGQRRDAPSEDATVDPSEEPQSIAEFVLQSHVDEALTSGKRMGVESAPLVLEVFEDFLCSHCLNFTVNVEPMLIEEYVNEGKLAIEFRHFPVLGRGSVASAIAAECALEQEAFWPYHRQLFANQANGVAPSANGFIGLASNLELDLAAFEVCLNESGPLAAVQEDFDLGQNIGFTGTPSFRLNGEALPGQPASLDGWRALLDERLSAAE
jgi:protein-disulfide isomerase